MTSRPIRADVGAGPRPGEPMNPRFTTILDRSEPESTSGSVDIAAARIAWRECVAAQAGREPEVTSPLLNPTLLAGFCLIQIESSGDHASLDFSLNQQGDAGEPWGGPVRLNCEGVSAIETIESTPQNIGHDDPVVWHELHLSQDEQQSPFVLVLQFASDQRLRIEADRISFCSVGLPC